MTGAATLRIRGGAVAWLGALAALGFGLLLPTAPLTAVLVIALVPLAFAMPVATLGVLVGVTVLVPIEVQETFAVLGGPGTPSLLVVDALVLLGLCRVGWLLARRRLAISPALLVAAAVGLVLSAALVMGIAHGAALSEAGHEARRAALGVGTFLMAWPVVSDPVARRRLAPVLLGVGLALGLWGLAQWTFEIALTASADVGVRPGVDLTSDGRGQLQGGLFAYPVAVVVAWASLISAGERPAWVPALLGTVIGLNGVCLLLTFERSFWVATLVACGIVALRSDAGERRRAALLAGIGAVLLLGTLAVLAPGELRTAVERAYSVTRLGIDTSLSARVVESLAVVDAIAARPMFGSGFGATVTWGDDNLFATSTTSYVHNGYLWSAWKIGIPAAVAVHVAIGVAALRRRPATDDRQWRDLRTGSQAALLALLATGLLFPFLNALGVTSATGLLVAVACCPPGDARG